MSEEPSQPAARKVATGVSGQVFKVMRISSGVLLLLLGVVGLFLPLLQGVLLLIAGLAVLAVDVPLARNLYRRLKSWRRRRSS